MTYSDTAEAATFPKRQNRLRNDVKVIAVAQTWEERHRYE